MEGRQQGGGGTAGRHDKPHEETAPRRTAGVWAHTARRVHKLRSNCPTSALPPPRPPIMVGPAQMKTSPTVTSVRVNGAAGGPARDELPLPNARTVMLKGDGACASVVAGSSTRHNPSAEAFAVYSLPDGGNATLTAVPASAKPHRGKGSPRWSTMDGPKSGGTEIDGMGVAATLPRGTSATQQQTVVAQRRDRGDRGCKPPPTPTLGAPMSFIQTQGLGWQV